MLAEDGKTYNTRAIDLVDGIQREKERDLDSKILKYSP